MSTMRLIGLGYKSGVGKDFIAREVLRPLGWQNIAHAWAIKEDGMNLRGFSYEDLFVTKPGYVRDWLQKYGLAKREEDPGVWLKRLRTRMQILHYEGGIEKFVVTDVRFENEFHFLRDALGGTLVKVTHGDRPYPLLSTTAALHPSETELDRLPDEAWDAVLVNDTSQTPVTLQSELYSLGVLPRARGTPKDSLQLSLF